MVLEGLEFLPVGNSDTRVAARRLITEYLQWLAVGAAERYGLSFDIEAMVSADLEASSRFWPPHGRFYVIRSRSSFVGVGGLKQLSTEVGEIERMYVQPHVRGIGAGRRLLERLINDGREIGYRVLKLESLKFLTAAHTLYRSVGFVEIPPYADNSMQEFQAAEVLGRYRTSAIFMQLVLDPNNAK